MRLRMALKCPATIIEKTMDNAGYKLQNVTTTKLGRFAVVRGHVMQGGKEYPYSYLHEKNCVCICPFIEQDVVLIRQYRYSVNDWCLELPCGAIEDGEHPEHAAARELLEETGCVPEQLTPLGDCYASAGISDCRVYFYLAECDTMRGQELDPTEKIERLRIPIGDFDAMIASGRFAQLMGIACWLRAKGHLTSHRENNWWEEKPDVG